MCPRCKKEKEFGEFPKSLQKKSGIYPYCKICCIERSRVWRKQNPETYNLSKKRRIQKLREKIWRYLRSHPCVDCGCVDIRVLQFDHNRDKVNHISSMVGSALSWELIKKEIKKCDVRCANCHIIKTAKQFKWYSFKDKVL